MAAADRRPSLVRLAAAIGDQRTPQVLRYRAGTVSAISVGTGADGEDEVTVDVAGDEVTAPYDFDAYNSGVWAVGDPVAVLLVDSSPLILCRLGGLPTP